jgi:hypothetical protein
MFQIILYIDPGSGSLIFQVILSFIISSALFYKQVKFRVIHMFKWIFRYAFRQNK